MRISLWVEYPGPFPNRLRQPLTAQPFPRGLGEELAAFPLADVIVDFVD